jgi:spore coat polysaccharide biosynthesis protein SpsF
VSVVAIVQARRGSTRLPGKVLLELVPGRTVLDLTLERLRACRRLEEIVVAVPEAAADDPVAAEARRLGATVFRGSEHDVLGRYHAAARAARAELVVRVTSDCPLIDPAIVDLHVERLMHRWRQADFVTNMLLQSYPLGLAVEAMPLDTLARMDRLSTTPYLRQHVTTLAYERPELFAIENVVADVNRSDLRWTLDYPADLALLRLIYGELYRPGRVFPAAEALALVERRPELATFNLPVPA